jgi:hypothetical protein
MTGVVYKKRVVHAVTVIHRDRGKFIPVYGTSRNGSLASRMLNLGITWR